MKNYTSFFVLILVSMILFLSSATTQQQTLAAGETSTPTAIQAASTTYLGVLFKVEYPDASSDSFSIYGADNWEVSTDEDGAPYACNDATTGYSGIQIGSPDWHDFSLEYRAKFVSWDPNVRDSGVNTVDLRAQFNPYSAYTCGVTIRGDAFTGFYSEDLEKARYFAGGKVVIGKDTWYTLRCDIKGDKIRVFINGRIIIDTRDRKANKGNNTGILALGMSPQTRMCLGPITVRSLDNSPKALAASAKSTLKHAVQPILNLTDKRPIRLNYGQKGDVVFILDTNTDKKQTLVHIERTGIQGWIPSNALEATVTPASMDTR